jgi:type IV secretory pathway VirB4 component
MSNNNVKNQNQKPPSTQQYLDIAEIRDGVVVMKNGSLRAVVLVSSVNFALKSEEEQEATIQAYVSFLNHLDHQLQVVVQSRKLNIEKYLNQIGEMEKKQTNELLRMQTAEYRQFVTELVELGEIMSKKFYVVVPYTPGADKKKGFMDKLSVLFSPTSNIHLKEKRFQELKMELNKRLETIMGGLTNMGLNAIVLDTQALIELFYNTYNPEVAEQQKMTDVGQLRVE